jgi:hypothetical protein
VQEDFYITLERNLGRKLDAPRPASTEKRIADACISRGDDLVRTLLSPGEVVRRAGVSDEVWHFRIRKVGMIEQIEELRAELQVHTLAQCGVLVDREIELLKARPFQRIAGQIAEVSGAGDAIVLAAVVGVAQ